MFAYFHGVRKRLTKDFDCYLSPDDAAVIVIDMTKAHCDAKGPCPSPRGMQILGDMEAFLASARKLGVPVIHVKTKYRKGSIDGWLEWRRVYPMTVGPIPNIGEHAIEGSKWAESMIRIHPEDHLVDTKKSLSVFKYTDTELLLRCLGRKTLVLTGLMTDCCVINSAFDAQNLRFRVVVPRNLTRGFSEELEDAAFKMISLHLGLVVDSKDLVDEWRRRSAGSRRRK